MLDTDLLLIIRRDAKMNSSTVRTVEYLRSVPVILEMILLPSHYSS